MIHKVGDKVWCARCGQREVTETCPVCFGKRQVKLTLGNGEEILAPCEYCEKGFEGPQGVVKEYHWIADVALQVITGVRIETKEGAEEVHYSFACYYFDAQDVFETKEEAEARVAVKIAEHEAEEAKRLSWRKEHDHRSYSWHVGYHKKCAKRAADELAYHNAKVIAYTPKAKAEKAKAPTPEPTPF